jgi:hypothetical protein
MDSGGRGKSGLRIAGRVRGHNDDSIFTPTGHRPDSNKLFVQTSTLLFTVLLTGCSFPALLSLCKFSTRIFGKLLCQNVNWKACISGYAFPSPPIEGNCNLQIQRLAVINLVT